VVRPVRPSSTRDNGFFSQHPQGFEATEEPIYYGAIVAVGHSRAIVLTLTDN